MGTNRRLESLIRLAIQKDKSTERKKAVKSKETGSDQCHNSRWTTKSKSVVITIVVVTATP